MIPAPPIADRIGAAQNRKLLKKAAPYFRAAVAERKRMEADKAAAEFVAMIRKHKFRVGQRVRPSPYGQASLIFMRKHFDARGVVTKVDKWNSPSVRWEHRKTSSSYFAGFIEPDRRRARALGRSTLSQAGKKT